MQTIKVIGRKKHGTVTFTPDNIEDIKRQISRGYTMTQLAKKYNVGIQVIGKIYNDKIKQ